MTVAHRLILFTDEGNSVGFRLGLVLESHEKRELGLGLGVRLVFNLYVGKVRAKYLLRVKSDGMAAI